MLEDRCVEGDPLGWSVERHCLRAPTLALHLLLSAVDRLQNFEAKIEVEIDEDCERAKAMGISSSGRVQDSYMVPTTNEAVIAPPKHIKSRTRVRDLGEVYTQPREVRAMLDLIPEAFEHLDTRFLEPAAGDGNFLVAILERKFAAIRQSAHGGTDHWYEFALLRGLASTYGIDISDENVREARERMTAVVDAAHVLGGQPATANFATAVESVLMTNVVVGDSLNAADKIVFVEYLPLEGERFQRIPSVLETPELDLFFEPLAQLPTVHYSELTI